MTRVSHPITNRDEWLKLREGNLNASEFSALYCKHAYTSALRLWAEKSKKIDREQVDNLAIRRGHLFESATGAALKMAHPDWDLRAGEHYWVMPQERIGATPDFIGRDEKGEFLVQIKTVDEMKWETEWTPTPPVGFLIQCQVELLVTEQKRMLLAALVMNRSFDVHEYWFDADEEMQASILTRAAQFWQAVADGREPKLDGKHDRGTLAALYPDPDREAVASLHHSPEIIEACGRHKALGTRIRAMEAEREELGVQIVGALRNHAKAEAGPYRISWPVVEASSYQVNKKAHRRLSIREIG